MKARGIWNEVRALVAAKQVPVIEIEPGAEIRIPKRPRGRPRTNPPWDRFAGWKMKTPSGLPMRCRNQSCSKPLRKDQIMVCSDRCREELVDYCRLCLDIMEGRTDPRDLPSHWRSNRVGTKPRQHGLSPRRQRIS